MGITTLNFPMKTKLLLLLLGLCSTVVSRDTEINGQTNSNTLIVPGSSWSVLYYGLGTYNIPCCVSTQYIYFDGDSIVADKTYKKVFSCNDELHENITYEGLIREQDKKTWFLSKGFENESLLYDFSLEEGVEFEYASYMDPELTTVSLYVKTCDMIEINGSPKKRLQISSPQSEDDGIIDTWLEGIGSLSGILQPCYRLFLDGGVRELLCHYKEDEQTYKNPAYSACYYDEVEVINKNTIVNNNSVWNILSIQVEDETGIVNIPRHTTKIYFEGDSVVNDKAYKKVFNCTDDEFCKYPSFAGLIREENLKTYYIFAGQAQEYLLYDFSVEVNDTIEMYCPQIESTLTYRVHNIDVMNVNGISKKRIELTYPDSETITDIWVEDLGSLFDFITINPMVGYVKRLLCFYRDDVCLYHDPDYEACYYTTSISEIQQPGFHFFIRSKTLNIEFDIPFNGDIYLHEAGGKLVYRNHLSNRFHHKINVSGFASGVYLLTLTADNGKKRFVKINHIK